MGLVVARFTRDASWTLIIILILTSGLTGWILIPSASDSLENGLNAYANRVSTFIVIQSYTPAAPGNLAFLNMATQIRALAHVEEVYPVTMRYVNMLVRAEYLSGDNLIHTIAVEGISSAVIGGPTGFPERLILLSEGHLPEWNESGFLLNDNRFAQVNRTGEMQMMIGAEPQDWNGTQGVKFYAHMTGVTALNPLTAQATTLWNASFLEHLLGPQLFNSTFGGYPNFMIVKADSIDNVERVVDGMNSILKNNNQAQDHFVTYDEASLLALQGLKSQSLPLYELMQGASFLAMLAVVSLVSYLVAARRKWEPGLLITQGWTWGRYARLMLSYYVALALVASAASVVLSLIVEHFWLFQYQAYGSVVTITTTVNPLYVVSAFPLAVAVSGAASLVSVLRIKRMGLDDILRDY